MKKSIFAAAITSLVLLLSGCGGNMYPDGDNNGTSGEGNNTSLSKITTTLQKLTIDKSNGSISADIELDSSYEDPIKVTLNDLMLKLEPCELVQNSVKSSPESVTLDSRSPSKMVSVAAKLKDPSCVPNSYQLTGKQELDDNGSKITSNFDGTKKSIDADKILVMDSNALSLVVATKRLDINESGAQKDIVVNVLRGIVGEANKKVKISNISDIVGTFASSDATSDRAGDALFKYTAPDPIVDKSFDVKFCLEENSSVCDTAKINLTNGVIAPPPIDNINYLIKFEPNGGANNLALNSRNNAVVTLIDKDTGEAIDSSRIKSIKVISRDTSVLKLTPEGGGNPASTVVFGKGRNKVSVLLTADDQNSGLAVLEVEITYDNLNGVEKTRAQLFSVAVLSGAPTAFSINSDGVSYNFNTKQFEHKFIIQATDASGNPVSTTGVINVAAMASFAKDANGREMLYGRYAKQNDGISATLTPDGDKAKIEITGISPFDEAHIKTKRAFVAVFGDVETYEANGKWNLESILSTSSLSLSNRYTGQAQSGLGMAIGYNYRDKFCTSDYQESVVVVDSSDGQYMLDSSGKAVVVLKHDAYMIGKRAAILVNMTGLNPNTGEVLRMGESHFVTLSSFEGLAGKTITVPKTASNYPVGIYGKILTGTDDTYWLRNSTFTCGFDLQNVTIDPNSIVRNDPASCDQEVAFLEMNVTIADSTKDGSVTFKNCQVNDEGNF